MMTQNIDNKYRGTMQENAFGLKYGRKSPPSYYKVYCAFQRKQMVVVLLFYFLS